jgi:hypothetical protein
VTATSQDDGADGAALSAMSAAAAADEARLAAAMSENASFGMAPLFSWQVRAKSK